MVKKKRKKYYKVVIIGTELIPVIRKQVHVNVTRCFVKDGMINVCRDKEVFCYKGDTSDFFIKAQRGKYK